MTLDFDVFFLPIPQAVHKSSATKPSIEDIYIIWMIIDDGLHGHKHQDLAEDLTCVCIVVFLLSHHSSSTSVCMYVYFQTHPNCAAPQSGGAQLQEYTNLFTMPQLCLELPTALCKYRYQRINSFRRQLCLVKMVKLNHRFMSLEGIRLLSEQFQSDQVHQSLT